MIKQDTFYNISTDFDAKGMAKVHSRELGDLFSSLRVPGYPFIPSTRFMRGEIVPPNLPIVFKRETGTKYMDCIWPSYFFLLISHRVANLWRQHQFTGYSLLPAVIYHKKEEILGYSVVIVHGRAGAESRRDAQEVDVILPNGQQIRTKRGVDPGLDKWDGSDFFMTEGTSRIYITKRVRDVLVGSMCTGFSITDIYYYP